MSVLDRLRKASTIKQTSVLEDSTFFNDKDSYPTDIPILNVALAGALDGGLTAGFLQLAGPSKHFKSRMMLEIASAFMKACKEAAELMKANDDAVVLFYDSEFGSPSEYFKASGIDPARVIHTPIVDVEELKHDLVNQLQHLTRDDKVIILIDSIGNLGSRKEANDALEGNDKADFTRAKQLKSLFRIVTPHLTLKNIPMIAINHTYKTMEMYSKDVVGGGCIVEGTEIVMWDGSLRRIEDVSVGDVVKTAHGVDKVSETWTPDTLIEGEPECFEVEFEDGHKVICSDKHRFFINDEWVEARNLRVGDEVLVV